MRKGQECEELTYGICDQHEHGRVAGGRCLLALHVQHCAPPLQTVQVFCCKYSLVPGVQVL